MKFFSNLFWTQLMRPRVSRIRVRTRFPNGAGDNLARFEPACQFAQTFAQATGRLAAFPSLLYKGAGMSFPSSAVTTERFRLQQFWARARISPAWMVGIAFTVRVLCIVVMHTYKVRTTESNFGFGWEMGRIGASLASGHGFSNPFQYPTGPTAWEPPLTPFLIAEVFKLFGIYTRASS